MRLSFSFGTAVSGCVLVAMAPHAFHLAQTDWLLVSQEIGRTLIAPVIAAGSTTAADSHPVTAPVTATAGLAAGGPQGQPLLTTSASGRTNTVAIELEQEMGRLLGELRDRQPPREPTAVIPMTGLDLARAALATRVTDAARRLEEAQARLVASTAHAATAATAELAKPKLIFESMKPVDAAAIITSLDEGVAAQIFGAMEERKAAAVLAAMPADRAARITLVIKSLGIQPAKAGASRR